MKLPHIFSNRQFRWVVAVVAVAILAFVLINILIIGGDLFLFTFNGSLNSPLAIIITIAAISVWRLIAREETNRLLWSGIMTGWALWALAETIWAVYSILEKEVPYPSLADLFWIIGYIPMGIGLFTRIRTMPVRPNRTQNILIWTVSAATILITIFLIIIPIIQSFDSQRLIESIPNLLYPLADVFLVTIIWHLFFTYEEGDYGFSWRLLTRGFFTMMVADLVFTYATWNEIYYPDMQANVISRFGVDVPYTVSYLLWFIGIYALRIQLKIQLKEEHPIEPSGRVRIVRTYGHILVFTKQDDTVIDVSPNYARFFETTNVKGKTLAEALTIPAQESRAIIEKLRTEGKVADLPFQVLDRSGTLRDIKLCGLAVYDPQKTYRGSNILLRMRVADVSFDDSLNQESRSMARYLLVQSGSSYQAEIGQFLADYYLSYIKSLLDMASHQGGTAASQALMDRLLETAKRHNWPIQFNLLTVLDSANYPLEVLRDALPVLLDTARQFVSDITDPSVVKARMKEVSSQFSPTVHRDIERYGKAEGDMGFSDHRKGIPLEPR